MHYGDGVSGWGIGLDSYDAGNNSYDQPSNNNALAGNVIANSDMGVYANINSTGNTIGSNDFTARTCPCRPRTTAPTCIWPLRRAR